MTLETSAKAEGACAMSGVAPVITFPQGLVGCADWQRFALLGSSEELVSQLQCLDHDGVCLLATDPRHICPDYQLHLSAADRRLLDLRDGQEPLILCTLTMRRRPLSITANLLGPLVINLESCLGRQLVLADSPYSPRHPVEPLPLAGPIVPKKGR